MATIRDATDADSRQICALLGELGYPAREDEIPPRLAELRRDPRATVFVAELEGRVVGVATAHVISGIHTTPPVGMLTALVVGESARGRGVGRELVAHAESWVRERGAIKISLTSALHRTQAHAFYKRLGYDHTGVRLARPLDDAVS